MIKREFGWLNRAKRLYRGGRKAQVGLGSYGEGARCDWEFRQMLNQITDLANYPRHSRKHRQHPGDVAVKGFVPVDGIHSPADECGVRTQTIKRLKLIRPPAARGRDGARR
jgi:hypothetical protein